MKIVFMGTPQYAVKTLSALNKAGHEIAAVFCQPDKPVGRKHILTAPPTKQYAEDMGIPVFQPSTLKDGQALSTLKNINPDIIVVVAYGKILPKSILELPKYGCVNGHASMLPKLRGASPIQWAIVTGEKTTGITTMYMDEGMDTGDILEQVQVDIGDEERSDQLFDRLSVISADLMVSTISKIESGTLKSTKQPENGVSYAPIIQKEMARLDFNKNSTILHNEIRGYYPWPCAFFNINGKRVKVLSSKIGNETSQLCGTVIEADNELVIACGNGTSLRLITVQPEGSKPMTSKQMLCGNKINVGTVIKEI